MAPRILDTRAVRAWVRARLRSSPTLRPARRSVTVGLPQPARCTRPPYGWDTFADYGGWACPWELSPQQESTWPLSIAQACAYPTLTCRNAPVGGLVMSPLLIPQHTSAPALVTAQVWRGPALTSKKGPRRSGG